MEIGGAAGRLRPGGSWPAVSDAVYGPTPSEMKKLCRYDGRTVRALQQVAGKVIASAAAGRISMLKAWLATSPAPSLTWIVKVKSPLRVGVPPIASPQQPKVEGMDRPGGSLPATTLKTGRLHGDQQQPPVIAMSRP